MIIKAKNLSKSFRSRGNKNLLTGLWRPEWKVKDAVSNVSFLIEAGEAVAFLGPNGAGKTTTTKMMTGLILPSSGSLTVLGETPFERDHGFLKQIGLVMGNRAGLNWDLTARQSFWLNRHIYGLSEEQYRNRVIELSQLLEVDMHLDTQVRRLSLGERMKLELIGAIMHQPTLLFLDEPTIGLDIPSKKTIRTFLRALRDAGKTTLILTSHDMDDIEEVCSRVIVINHGRKIYDDSLASLGDQYKGVRFVRFTFATLPPPGVLEAFGNILEAGPAEVLVRVDADRMVGMIATISAGYPVLDMRVESVPLEEIMAELFASGRHADRS